MSTISSDLLIIEQRKQEFTPIHELKQISLLLQTLESKLQSFSQYLPRLDRRRALMNLGGKVLKFIYGSATVQDIHKQHEVSDKLNSRNSDLAHSLTDQLTYIKKLDTVTAANIEEISNLSNIIKDNVIKSHDTFQKITRDILWLNVTIYAQVKCIWQFVNLNFLSYNCFNN